MAIVCTLTVSYNANGGSGAPSGANYTSGGDSYPVTVNAALASSRPSRTYYNFLGWSKSSTATSASYAPGSTYSHVFTSGTTASVVFYAVWQHQTAYVNYNANGGSGAPAQQSHWAGYSVTLSSTVPTRSGYTFLGWSTSSTATTASYQPGNSYALYTTTTLYAVWKLATYTVSYNKGTNGTGTNTSDTKTHGTALTLKGAIFTRTGYTQTGWSTSDGGAKTYNLSASYTTNAAITLYPFWTANTYTVSYDKGVNGTGTNMTDTKTHDVPLVLQNALFTRTSYEQTGWSLTDGGEEEYELGETYTANAAITLYPFWTFTTPTYTIMYNANGGSGAPASQTKIQDEEIYLSSTTPTLGSCAFLGWATSKANAKNRVIAYNAGDPYTTNANLTLYAVWDTDSIVFRKTATTNTNLLPKMQAGIYEGNGVRFVVNHQGVCTMSGTTTASGNAAIIPLESEFTLTQDMLDAGYRYHLNNSTINGNLQPTLEYTAGQQTMAYSLTPINRVVNPTGQVGYTFKQVRFWISSGITLNGTFAPAIMQSTTAIPYEPYEPFPNKMKLAFVHVKKNGNMVHSSVFVKSENGTMVKV